MFEQFKTQALAYLKNVYSIEFGDLGITDETIKQSIACGETPIQFIDWYAEKYGLTKREDLTIEDAMQILKQFKK